MPYQRAARLAIGYALQVVPEDELEALERRWGLDRAAIHEEHDRNLPVSNDLLITELAAFESFLAFDHRLPSGFVPAAALLETGAPGLGPAEARYLGAAVSSVTDLYEVAAVEPGEAIEFRSLLRDGGRIRVRERLASKQLRAHDLVLARVLDFGDHREMVETVHVNHAHKAPLVEWFEREVRAPGKSGFELLKARGTELVRELARLLRERRPSPKVLSAEGDPVELGQAEYDILERKRLVEALAATKGLAATKHRGGTVEYSVPVPPAWKAAAEDLAEGEGVRLEETEAPAGRIIVRRTKAIAEGGSRRRLAHVRQVLEHAAPGAARFVRERVESAAAAILKKPRKPRAKKAPASRKKEA